MLNFKKLLLITISKFNNDKAITIESTSIFQSIGTCVKPLVCARDNSRILHSNFRMKVKKRTYEHAMMT